MSVARDRKGYRIPQMHVHPLMLKPAYDIFRAASRAEPWSIIVRYDFTDPEHWEYHGAWLESDMRESPAK